jgi:hypothetical protein
MNSIHRLLQLPTDSRDSRSRFAAGIVVVGVIAFTLICSLANRGVVKASAFATLVSVSDSLGNINTNSASKGTGLSWSCSPGCPDLVVQAGETIILTAVGTDPEGLPLQYKFSAQPAGGSFEVRQNWSADNTYVWNVSPADIGPDFGFAISVRNNDGDDYQGEFMGDDYALATYQVFDPAYSPATLVSLADSIGNVNTNSVTKGTGPGWSCSPYCPDLTVEVGETVILTAVGTDPNGLPLQYKFSAQPAGGSFEVRQDWSADNTYVWNVSPADIGPDFGFAISVRNNDGQEWQGPGLGDDYTYAIYEVVDPVYSPALLLEIRDSLGNVNTNSVSKGTGGDWPFHFRPSIAVSDVITFTAVGTDPNSLPLEYKFARQRTGGSFIVLQDWSSQTTYTWAVTRDDYGADVGISIHVRNDDGQEWQGTSLGDDYTYAIYEVLTVREVISQTGGSLMAPNSTGTMLLSVPSGAVSQTTVFSYTENLNESSIPDNFTIAGSAFSLAAQFTDGTPVVSFSKPVSIELNCGPNTLVDLDTVTLFYFDDQSGQWVALDQNPTTMGPCQFAATTTHLTQFAFASRLHRLYVPLVSTD